MAQTTDGAKQKPGSWGQEPGFLRAIRPAPRKRESDGADKNPGRERLLEGCVVSARVTEVVAQTDFDFVSGDVVDLDGREGSGRRLRVSLDVGGSEARRAQRQAPAVRITSSTGEFADRTLTQTAAGRYELSVAVDTTSPGCSVKNCDR